MSEFAGFEMPIMYQRIQDEHMMVRTNVAECLMFRTWASLLLRVHQAKDLVQWLTTNDVENFFWKSTILLPQQRTRWCVDDLLVYCLAENKYLLVVNAANIEKDLQHILQQNRFDANVHNQSDQWACWRYKGPKVAELLQTLTSVNLADIRSLSFCSRHFAGIEMWLFRLPATPAQVVWIYFLMKKTSRHLGSYQPARYKPAGLGTRYFALGNGLLLVWTRTERHHQSYCGGLGLDLGKNYFWEKNLCWRKTSRILSRNFMVLPHTTRYSMTRIQYSQQKVQ